MAEYQQFNRRSIKLSDAEVVEALRLYHEEKWSQGRIARKLNVSAVTIGRYVRGESRRDVFNSAPVDTSEAEMDPQIPSMTQEEIAKIEARLAAKLAEDNIPVVSPLDEIMRRRGGEDPLARFRKLHEHPSSEAPAHPEDLSTCTSSSVPADSSFRLEDSPDGSPPSPASGTASQPSEEESGPRVSSEDSPS